MEKVREKYDVLLQDAEIALMQRRNEWKANVLKAYANMLLTEVWKIDLKAVSSGTRKGTISETSCPSSTRSSLQITAPAPPSHLPAIYNSSLNQQFSSSSTIAPAVGTNPAPRQLAGLHHIYLPLEVDGLCLPICHGLYRDMC